MIFAIASLALPWFACFLFANRIWPERSIFALALKLSVALGLAIGLTSLAFFVYLYFLTSSIYVLALVEGTAALGCILACWERQPRADSEIEPGRATPSIVLLLAFSLVSVPALGGFAAFVAANPHGGFDSVLIWNLRARFLHRAGDDWRTAYSPDISPSTHPDYPLLLPTTVARLWNYAGADDTALPQLATALFTLGTIALLVGALGCLRSPSQGLLAGLVLLGTPFFLVLGSTQIADVPLGFFFLGTMALMTLHEARDRQEPGLLFLAGLFAGFAAWTKNEGILFVLVVGAAQVVRLIADFRDGGACRNGLAFLSGLAAPLTALVLFKATLAPDNDILAGQSGTTTTERMLDVARYGVIAKAFLQAAVRLAPGILLVLPVYLLLLGRTKREERGYGLAVPAAVPALMFAGYFGVYIVTPNDLDWHLRTSLDRLFIQLWPLALLAYFSLVATPEERAARNALKRPAREGEEAVQRRLTRQTGQASATVTVR